MQIDGAKWPLSLQYFPRVFGLGFNFHGFLFVGLCLRVILGILDMVLDLGMEMKKIKVYTLIDDEVSPKYIGTMNGEDGESLAELEVRLEE